MIDFNISKLNFDVMHITIKSVKSSIKFILRD